MCSVLLRNIYVTNDHEYGLPFVVIMIRSCPHSWLITRFVTRITRLIPHVEQELLTLPEHLKSSSVFSWVHITRSLVFCVVVYIALFVPLSYFFWPLYCLTVFDLRCPMIPLVSSNFYFISFYFFFTLEPDQPQAVHVKETEQKAITVSWTRPVCDKLSPFVTYYILNCCPVVKKGENCTGG